MGARSSATSTSWRSRRATCGRKPESGQRLGEHERWRSRYDHPKIPNGVTIIGVTDELLSMHYFDERGVYRVYATSLERDTWRYWRDAPAPDLSQRFTGTFSDDGNTITGRGQMSKDGSTWERDLDLNYRRVT